MSKVYAVAQGRKVGVFDEPWSQVRTYVDGYKGAVFKGFKSRKEAEAFLQAKRGGSSASCESRGGSFAVRESRGGSFAVRESRGGSSACREDASFPCSSSSSSSQRVVVYTDGSCLSNGFSGARAGYGVFYAHGDDRNMSGRLPGDRQTNQRAELYAIQKVVRRHEDHVHIHICSDSMYCINTFTDWMPSWHSGSRKKYTNLDLMLSTFSEIQQRSGKVTFEYVPAHSNVPGNEAADQLAKKGANQPHSEF